MGISRYDWRTKRWEAPTWLVRHVYQTFRSLARYNDAVSVEELAAETNLPIEAVIAAVQKLCHSEVAPVTIVTTPLTDFIVGRETVGTYRLQRAIRKVAGNVPFGYIEIPLTAEERKKKVPVWGEDDIDEETLKDLENIDL
ncbi:hypothetical protein SAMN06265339_0687 [Desulfurobacterium pacificum]|uniref:Winged helix-turn-helix domain-containing protein n=1 Tax=Desulfurobacterium pacificum TaxID=240166 RepID=A0ABY1NGG1_9BACT|nr:hypothetical protein [Desulfurobacterium pacificum]SMP09046.1 hypothetical protein SAMN06265339_0687 [Desulfurobacterium pacificum]